MNEDRTTKADLKRIAEDAFDLPKDYWEAADLPHRLRAAVLRWFHNVGVFRPSRHDIVRRLRLDASGPGIHPGYYRQDLIDAADEIERLRDVLESIIATSENTKALHKSDRQWALDLTEQAKAGVQHG